MINIKYALIDKNGCYLSMDDSDDYYMGTPDPFDRYVLLWNDTEHISRFAKEYM